MRKKIPSDLLVNAPTDPARAQTASLPEATPSETPPRQLGWNAVSPKDAPEHAARGAITDSRALRSLTEGVKRRNMEKLVEAREAQARGETAAPRGYARAKAAGRRKLSQTLTKIFEGE